MNAIYRKELRDVIRWAPLGIILLAVLGWMSLPTNIWTATNVHTTIASMLGIGAALIAIALGLLQSLPEARNDVRGYLVHRPVALSTIFWAKLLAGLTAYLICLIPVLSILAIYLESIGPEQLPTTWKSVLPLAFSSLAIFMLHPAAIWMTSREAKWVGTRWFPMIFASACAFLLSAICLEVDSIVYLALLLVLYLGAWFIVAAAALHAFTHQIFSPPYQAKNGMSKIRLTSLLITSIILTFTLSVILTDYAYSKIYPRARVTNQYRMVMNKDGRIWSLSHPDYMNSSLVSTPEGTKGRPISGLSQDEVEAQRHEELPTDWEELGASRIQGFNRTNRGLFSYGMISFRSSFSINNEISASDAAVMDGRIYLYQYGTRRLIGVLTPRGFYRTGEIPKGRFNDSVSVIQPMLSIGSRSVAGQPLIVDDSGVYQFDGLNSLVRKVIDTPTEYFGMTLPTEQQNAAIWIINSDDVERYSMEALDTDHPIPFADAEQTPPSVLYSLPAISSKLTRQLPRPDSINFTGYRQSIVENKEETLAILGNSGQFTLFTDDGSLAAQGTVSESDQPIHTDDIFAIAFPPGFIAGLVVYTNYFAEETLPIFRPFIGGVVMGHAIFAILIAQWFCTVLGLTMKQRFFWSLIAAIVGLSVVVALLAIYPWPVREKCSRCEALRSVDQQRCQKCGADWDPPQPEGIEILGEGNTVISGTPSMA